MDENLQGNLREWFIIVGNTLVYNIHTIFTTLSVSICVWKGHTRKKVLDENPEQGLEHEIFRP